MKEVRTTGNYLSLSVTGYTLVYFFHSQADMKAALAERQDMVAVMGHGGGLDADFPGVYFAVSKEQGEAADPSESTAL